MTVRPSQASGNPLYALEPSQMPNVQELLAHVISLKDHPEVQKDDDLLSLFQKQEKLLRQLPESATLDAEQQTFYRMANQLILTENRISPFVRKILLKNSSSTGTVEASASPYSQEIAKAGELLAVVVSLKDHPEVQKDEELLQLFRNKAELLIQLPECTELSEEEQKFYRMAQQLVSENKVSSFVKRLLLKNAVPAAPAQVMQPRFFAPVIRIDASGKDGMNGSQGNHGAPGGNARDINLQLAVKDGDISVTWENGRSFLKITDASAPIFLRAVGGKGGKGGNGRSGAMGRPGANGMNATQYSPGTNGDRGGAGERGQDGGRGGNGGKGGDVKVHVDHQDSDLLMLIGVPELSGGSKGEGGSGGSGGEGGPGGHGGASRQWTESKTHSRSVRDPTYGNSTFHSYHTEYYTTTENHFLHGGANGLRGPKGAHGSQGNPGIPGSHGSLQMIVGANVYKALYDLHVTTSKVVDLVAGNPENIYEPGEIVNLKVSVASIGGMPTPLHGIDISLLPAWWIEINHSCPVLHLSEQLLPGASRTFLTPFSFQVKEHAALTGEPLNKQEELTYKALLRRINKAFFSVAKQKNLFSVRYPIQLLPFAGNTTIAFGETSILRLSVQSVTPISMGMAGDQKRKIFVTFEVEDSEDVKSSDVEVLKTEESDHQEGNKVIAEVDCLPPRSEKNLGVSFRFINPTLRAQAKIQLLASLHLGYLSSVEESAGMRCIQKRAVWMQYCVK